jgi:acetylornithine deacetylase
VTDVATRLESLIRFRSDAAHGDEPALAAHLGSLLAAVQPAPDLLVVKEVPREAPARTGAYVFARWGKPTLLLNVHLDTVPPNAGWTSDPFTPKRENGRLVGLGAADTKGATAAILSALEEVAPRNIAILFSGDEETSGRCMSAFLKSDEAKGLTQAIVCEPTSCRVGIRHRGVLALEISIQGTGGHSSKADIMPAPLADAARLAVAYSDWGRARAHLGPAGFQGMCLNIARLDGGIAFNVVPSQATLALSARCPPDADPAQVRSELEGLARQQFPEAQVRAPVDHAPFQTRDLAAFEPWLGALARQPIDLGYWTEAALLAGAGIDAVVFGPGDIAQAHAPDEWVELEQLEIARRTFVAVLRGTSALAGRPESNGTR